MFRQWLTLVIIVLVYIPVAIDATVLHVAAPTLSMTLGASGNELLWIIDIYSLVMAGMVLPMGALGDRIGFKRLLMLGGTLFGLASLAAAFSHTASWLIATRVLLAIGAAMIVPATLAGIRATFCEEKHRNMALGVWAAVGSGGAAFGPLIGGILLEHFYWGSVFLINVPIVLVVMGLTARYVPRQAGRRDQPLNLGHAVMLIIAILLLVYSAKTALKGHLSLWVISFTLLTGALLLGLFIRTQLATSRPMIDMRLFTHRIILSGVVMAMTAMITLVGFELLMAQELQFVHGLSPYEAGVSVVFALVLRGKVQTFNQAKEVSVTVGGNTSSTASHEDVSLSPGIATKLWQNVGPCADVVSNAVVTTVVERTVVSEFQTSKRQTGFVFVSALAFSTVAFEFIFPLAKTG